VNQASSWVARWAPRIPPGGRVLDLACGNGRHAAFLARLGYEVEAVDIDLSSLVEEARRLPGVTLRQADLENGPWPYGTAEFAGIVVTRYLHRPLIPFLLDALGPGGVLIYETFAAGNERFGRPRNPDHLLRPGELIEAVRDRLDVVAYENLEIAAPKPAVVQRIAAMKLD
jgi:SAM-dependent methyltransferase